MEKALNTVLYVFFALFGLYLAYNHYQENYVPVPFEQAEAHAAPLFKVGQKVSLKEDPWFAEFLATPIPANGEAPEGWSEQEASLDAQACGECHAEQYAQWQSSPHAKAMGPAVQAHIAQASPAQVASCQSCHAPMTEQLPALTEGENPAYMADQRLQGVTCAGCHVRAHERVGPPAETSAPAEGAPESAPPHGGFTAAAQFSDAQLCASCHELPTDGPALLDKRLLETVSEWSRTDLAGEGQTCQSCHMAEGSHTWRGIEDAEFTKAALQAAAELGTAGGRFEPVRVTLTLTNAAVAHRFPSTSRPEVHLSVEQLDATGAPIAGTRQEGVVARRLSADASAERFDTRLMPGESFEVAYSAARHPDAKSALAKVEVWPRSGPHSLHGYSLNLPSDEALLQQADEASHGQRYVAWERTLELVPPPEPAE
ncbi:MAG: hypothetical protein H6740_11625 [Alphaproteobacteria bacterium]|nr:hypothetical protein [Alphaproteobacteria bacterium]